MLITDQEPLTDVAPLALLHHENSKLNPSTAAEMAETVGQFAADDELRRRSITSAKTYPTSERIDLAKVARRPRCTRSLADVLAQRRSVRRFSPRGVSLPVVASILETACGVTGELADAATPGLVQSLRATPSGGALYPTETYLVALRTEGFAPGIYHYHAPQQALEVVRRNIAPMQFAPLVLTAPEPFTAPAFLVLTARWEHPLRKYGERGYRIVLLDAGHTAQNLLLAATALDLAACPIAGFHDDALAAELGLDPRIEPVLYVILLGHAAE